MNTYRHEMPVDEDLAHELFRFWDEIFEGVEPDIPMEVFMGEEAEHNRHITLVEREGDDVLAGTCGYMISRRLPRLGGMGEVATAPQFRGKGIATRLCRKALAEFVELGGEAIFLGTESPDAARIYERLGWRRIEGSTVYCNVLSGDSPKQFLTEYFRSTSTVKVVRGDASLRIPMIPLLMVQHNWQILDGNVPEPMISTRYATQRSCMGLCRRYYRLVKRDDAEWFAAKTEDGRAVGIATARTDRAGVCYVDGFTHERFIGSYEGLIGAAIDWGVSRGSTAIAANLATQDDEKRAIFEARGFNDTGTKISLRSGDLEFPTTTFALDSASLP